MDLSLIHILLNTCAGEGAALAYGAGASLRNMEFIENWNVPKLFAWEGQTGMLPYGARFLNGEGEDFMRRYSPKLGAKADPHYNVRGMAFEVRAGREMCIRDSLGVIMTLLMMQVCYRYFGGKSIAWSEEVSRFLFLYLVYFAASLAASKNLHIRVTAQLKLLPKLGQMLLLLTTDIIWLIFCIIVVNVGTDFIISMSDRPKMCIRDSSSGVGRCSASTSATALPSPPMTLWFSAVTSAPVSEAALMTASASMGLMVWMLSTRADTPS